MHTYRVLQVALLAVVFWLSGCSSRPDPSQSGNSGKTQLTSEQQQEVDKDVERIMSEVFEQRTKADTKARDEKCVAECKRELREKVAEYRALFESEGSVHYHDTEWLSTVLANARTNFDNCLSTCD